MFSIISYHFSALILLIKGTAMKKEKSLMHPQNYIFGGWMLSYQYASLFVFTSGTTPISEDFSSIDFTM
jgi:hypothetical protein